MFKAFKIATAGLTAGVVAWFFATTPEVMLPSAASTTAHSVCDTGHRGQPDYDAQCLRTGTPAAAAWWFSTPEGKRGHERDDMTTRRGICKFAYRHGGVRREAAELVNDMSYDTYRNYKQVNGWVADAAQGDCLRLGYNDPTSGLVAVNLHHLPKGDCWYEVSYANRKHTKINIEPLCKG